MSHMNMNEYISRGVCIHPQNAGGGVCIRVGVRMRGGVCIRVGVRMRGGVC